MSALVRYKLFCTVPQAHWQHMILIIFVYCQIHPSLILDNALYVMYLLRDSHGAVCCGRLPSQYKATQNLIGEVWKHIRDVSRPKCVWNTNFLHVLPVTGICCNVFIHCFGKIDHFPCRCCLREALFQQSVYILEFKHFSVTCCLLILTSQFTLH